MTVEIIRVEYVHVGVEIADFEHIYYTCSKSGYSSGNGFEKGAEVETSILSRVPLIQYKLREGLDDCF